MLYIVWYPHISFQVGCDLKYEYICMSRINENSTVFRVKNSPCCECHAPPTGSFVLAANCLMLLTIDGGFNK